MKTETPNYQVIVGDLGFLLLQRYIFCRVLDIQVSQIEYSVAFSITSPVIGKRYSG